MRPWIFALLAGLVAPGLRAAQSDIVLWYGDELRFGDLGTPHPRISVLGQFSVPEEFKSPTYELNGGVAKPLSLGVDGYRLSRPGAFNAEIERSELRPGANEVTVRARSVAGSPVVTKTIRVNYTPDRKWPLPYAIYWSTVRRIEDAAEVIDGNWKLTSDGVRTLDPYYDRVLAMGDMGWTDYEVQTSVTFHKMLADVIAPKGPPFSNHAHASLMLRWRGHPDDDKQPHRKWHPTGALAMWRADAGADGNEWIWHGGESGFLAKEGKKRPLILGTRYLLRARVETLPGPKTRYSIKGWDARQAEPKDWDLVGIDGEQDMQSGSLLLVAHHSDVTFGDVEVRPSR